jgi:hypothetical protein
MYLKDGIVYASEPTSGLEVSSCRSVGDGVLIVGFSTGETRLFDTTCLLDMPAFAPLRNQSILDAFSIEDGILTWLDGEIDISPQAVYSRSYDYNQVA